jgi:Membrane bound O-acyl transferase family
MLDSYFKIYYDARRQRKDDYDAALSAGLIDPFVYPQETISVVVLLLAILFIPRLQATQQVKKITSISAFVLVVCLCASTIYRCRTIALAGGYGIGLMCAWGMVASGYLLVFNDAGTAFQRLERRDLKEESGVVTDHSSESNGSVVSGRNLENMGESASINKRIWGVNGPAPIIALGSQNDQSQPQHELVWQGFPESMVHRLDWVADLTTSFRGVHWNWRISTLPENDIPLPRSSAQASKTLRTSPPSTTLALRRQAIRDSIVQYLFIDLVKTVTLTDPYFHGTAPISSPLPWPLLTGHNTLTWFVRLLLSLAGVLSALTFVFSLSPLIFPLLPPSVTLAPLREPALYPPYWGPIGRSVLDKGLPGLWGKWWHQMFRFGVSEPSRYLISALGLPPRSQTSRIISVIIAFAISGSIHACASYTSFFPSRSIRGPLTFFMLQGLGVLGQPAFLNFISGNIYDTRTLPSWLRRCGNGLFVTIWLFLTGPLLANDFARCGIWLFEPLPISLFRGLLGQGFWCWSGQRVMWWPGREGEGWWRQGIVMI